MLVIPAIDIKDGKCVRLYQGDYSKVTVFSEDPVQMARHWQDLGAPLLHVVDLDGAKAGHVVNWEAIRAILREVEISVEVGGGIRDVDTAEELVLDGAFRVIFGTVALRDPGLIQEAAMRLGEAVVVGIDARDGLVATHGWFNISDIRAYDFARAMVGIGVTRIIYTDIERDGTLTEPNFTAIAEMVATVPVPIIASGGISKVEHLEVLRDMGVEGAIVGRALYEGKIDFEEAMERVAGE